MPRHLRRLIFEPSVTNALAPTRDAALVEVFSPRADFSCVVAPHEHGSRTAPRDGKVIAHDCICLILTTLLISL